MDANAEQQARVGIALDIGHALGPIVLRIIIGLLAVLVYGAASLLFSGGSSPRHGWLSLFGAVLSVVSLCLYPMAMFYGRSWRGAFFAWSGFVPYLFALYVMIALGGTRLYALLAQFSVTTLLAGLGWLAVGYWILYNFWIFTEAVSAADKARTRALDAIRTKAASQ